MADYYNPYSPYQPYVPPAPTFYPSLTTPRSVTQMPIQNNQNGSPNTFQWVQGQAGAEAYLVAPGASVILMDSNAPVIYFKSADQNGRYLPMKTYDLVERAADVPEQKPQLDTSSFVKRDEIEKLIAAEVDRQLNAPTKKEV